jgi:hypothetical protein
MESSGNNGESKSHKGTANLKMWQPGQSGNPAGRPKRHDAIKPLLDQFGPDAIRKLVTLMDSEDERIALMAAKEIADRAYGKAKPAEDEDEGDKRALTINIIRYTEPTQNDAPQVTVRKLVAP